MLPQAVEDAAARVPVEAPAAALHRCGLALVGRWPLGFVCGRVDAGRETRVLGGWLEAWVPAGWASYFRPRHCTPGQMR